MAMIGWRELLILLVIVLLIFGTKRLTSGMRELGKGVREFKKGVQEPDADVDAKSPPAQLRSDARDDAAAADPERQRDASRQDP